MHHAGRLGDCAPRRGCNEGITDRKRCSREKRASKVGKGYRLSTINSILLELLTNVVTAFVVVVVVKEHEPAWEGDTWMMSGQQCAGR